MACAFACVSVAQLCRDKASCDLQLAPCVKLDVERGLMKLVSQLSVGFGSGRRRTTRANWMS